jgi:hypothetical protein
MADTPYTEDYYQACVGSAKHPNELNVWWKRSVPPFSLYKVKLVSRRTDTAKQMDLLTFRFAAREELDPSEVDLRSQPGFAWADLPSTIQFATPGAPYGFLFLSDTFLKQEMQRLSDLYGKPIDLMALADKGGKWPPGAGLKMRTFIENNVHDKSLQAQLLEQLDDLYA